MWLDMADVVQASNKVRVLWWGLRELEKNMDPPRPLRDGWGGDGSMQKELGEEWDDEALW